MTIIFSPSVEYEFHLEKLKADFERRWNSRVVSRSSSLANYEEVAVLAPGTYGKVIVVQDKESKKMFAVKEMLKEKIVRANQVCHVYLEKRIMHSLHHPFVTSLKFTSKDNDRIYFGIEICYGGDMFSYLKTVKTIKERHARFYAAMILAALEYLHRNKIVYRNLKLENIMFDSVGYLKLIDFGVAKRIEGPTMTLCGTPEYLAPEIIAMKPYSFAVDWWAFGVMLYELVAGYTPFYAPNQSAVKMFAKICDGHFKSPPHFSPELNNLLHGLIEVDTLKRLGNKSTAVMRQHPWFKDINFVALLNREISAPYVPMAKTGNPIKKKLSSDVRSNANQYEDIFAEF